MSGSGKKKKTKKKKSKTTGSTTKESRAAISAKRKRMGLSAADSDDAEAGTAYDPQAINIAHHRRFVDVFQSKTGSAHGTMDYAEFRSAIDSMEDVQIGSGDALRAFTEVQDEDELDLEGFMNAVHVACPTYPLLWNRIFKEKFKYEPCDSFLMLSEIRAVLKNKKSSWREKNAALRFMTHLLCKPQAEDSDTASLFKQFMPQFTHAFRSNHQCVIREVCFALAWIAKCKKQCLRGSMVKLMNLCWEILDVQVPLIREAATHLTQALMKFVPDTKDNKVLKTLVQGLTLTDFRNVQETCYASILVLMKKNANPKKVTSVNPNFWGVVKGVIYNGLQVIEAGAADEFLTHNTFELLRKFAKYQPTKAPRIIEPMKNKMRDAYDAYTREAQAQSTPELRQMNSGSGSNSNTNTADASTEDAWSRSSSSSKPKKGRQILKLTYSALKQQLEHLVTAYDANEDGVLSVNETLEFLSDLLDMNGPAADVALRGLDSKRSGHIKQGKVFKYIIEHHKKLRPNPLLEKDAVSCGWSACEIAQLNKRKAIVEGLMAIEKTDRNYSALFDMDHKLCILNYLTRS